MSASAASNVHLHLQFQPACGAWWCEPTIDYLTLDPAGFQDPGVLRVGTAHTAGSSGSAPGSSCPAGVSAVWTCASDLSARVRCNAGRVENEPCASGCVTQATGVDDYCASAPPAPTCRESGQTCSSSQPCCGALSCNSGRCGSAPPPACIPTGGTCASSGQCCDSSNTCQSGRCTAPTPSVSWDCGRSAYGGGQYWTCSSGIARTRLMAAPSTGPVRRVHCTAAMPRVRHRYARAAQGALRNRSAPMTTAPEGRRRFPVLTARRVLGQAHRA